MVLFDSFSYVNLMVGTTLFYFSAISSIFKFRGRKMRSISSIYLKYVVLMGSLYLQVPDSKNSKYRHARTPLNGFSIGRPDFFLKNKSL